jgi:DNA ligase-1
LWEEVRYLVFDAPAAEGGFEARVKFVEDTLGKAKAEYARAHEHQLCKDVDCLRAELARVEALGGEGLMLRQPGSKYEAGRSSTLLKVKSFRDAEALVIGHQDGAGRHKGRLGALLVQLPNGIEFAVGTGFSDREREAPPAVGATVTFRYQELSEGGVPRFPSYVGERIDVTPIRAEKPKVVAFAAPSKPAKSPPSAAASGTSSATSARYFEFVEGTSSKFWEVSQSGADMTTRWGRIGTAGQSKTKTFADAAAAAKQVEKLIADKTDEGYVERATR